MVTLFRSPTTLSIESDRLIQFFSCWPSKRCASHKEIAHKKYSVRFNLLTSEKKIEFLDRQIKTEECSHENY